MKKGFTLAETLITIGIIGVVAALTLPTLMTNIQDKIFIFRFKKIYSQLNEVSKLLNIDFSEAYAAECRLYDDICLMELFQQKMKVAKVCKTRAIDNGCKASAKYKDGSTNNGLIDNLTLQLRPAFLTLDGYSIQFRFHEINNKHWGWLQIDVNGLAKPNIMGRDIFVLALLNGGMLKPIGYTPELNGYKDSFEKRKNGCTRTGFWCSSVYLGE